MRPMRTAIPRIVLVLAFAGCVDSADPPVTSDLDVELQLTDSTFAGDQTVTAEVTIVNTGDRSVDLLSWYLPATDLQEPLFDVRRDGQPVAYIGPRYKRAQPD